MASPSLAVDRARTAGGQPGAAPEPALAKPAKYRNRLTAGPNGQGGDRIYSSKREALHAVLLDADKRAGLIADFYPQVSLEVGTDDAGRPVRAVVDFLVVERFLEDGTFVGRFEDPKGADTLHSRAKRAALRARGMGVQTP